MKKQLLTVIAGCTAIALVLLAPSAIGAGRAVKTLAGAITTESFPSATLGEDISYNVYLPAGYESSGERYPVIYLLHGRGDSMGAWVRMQGTLDELIAAGELPPVIAVMPDAPWSDRASYYVDSAYTGSDFPGRPVETAFIKDLIPHVDATYRTVAERGGRAIAGYSMGGYGAMRYSLAHPQLFAASIVLSPAVYYPLPPMDSSTREFGAFGRGGSKFVKAVYRALNYPDAFGPFEDTGLPLHMFIGSGTTSGRTPIRGTPSTTSISRPTSSSTRQRGWRTWLPSSESSTADTTGTCGARRSSRARSTSHRSSTVRRRP